MMLLLCGAAAHAETLPARVIGVSDGDTIIVLLERQQVKVRLADIAVRRPSSSRLRAIAAVGTPRRPADPPMRRVKESALFDWISWNYNSMLGFRPGPPGRGVSSAPSA